MELINNIKTSLRNSNVKPKIIFVEGWNKLIQQACENFISEDLFEPALIFRTKAELPDNINVKTYIIDELDLSKYSNFLYELRKEKGLSLSEAQELVKQPNYLASILVALGEVDGEVCGIEYKTKDTYSPALKIIKGKDGKIVSSCIILNKNDQTLVFGDISLNLNPDSTQLVDIATEICLFSKNVIGLKNTNVAMLSYSTNKSGAGESVDKVVQASEKLKQINDLKEFNFSNDIQFDAAIDGAVRSKKASNLSWNDNAGIFIFPNIDAGNIGYKIAQRLGGYSAIGPFCVGMKKIVNDLSRGASLDEIINVGYITALQIINN